MDLNSLAAHMDKGWIVIMEDGSHYLETTPQGQETDWKKVPKRGIKSLHLKWHDKMWSIVDKGIYLQFKRAWISPGMAVPVVEVRCIGFWEGDCKVIYRVDDSSGQMKMVVQ